LRFRTQPSGRRARRETIEGSHITQLIIEIVAGIALLILMIVTSRAALVVSGRDLRTDPRAASFRGNRRSATTAADRPAPDQRSQADSMDRQRRYCSTTDLNVSMHRRRPCFSREAMMGTRGKDLPRAPSACTPAATGRCSSTSSAQGALPADHGIIAQIAKEDPQRMSSCAAGSELISRNEAFFAWLERTPRTAACSPATQ
jgi:hypothetical protein